ncbi:hypothetical protein LRY58_05135 [Candidatus Woesebacteria bacterium]|nr:hypothetical protein [Candidatus Woesebacteria bacterium]
MPQKNVDKEYYENAVYHVYNRGAAGSIVFQDDTDFWVFRRIARLKMKKMSGVIMISPFNILPNHFHLKVWQENSRDMEHLMRSVMTAFGKYYRGRHGGSGRVFETPYKATLISKKKKRKCD